MRSLHFQVFTAGAICFMAVNITSCKEHGAETNSANIKPVEIDVLDYYENGVVKMRGKNVDGNRTGQWESFYPSGYRWSEMNYRNGVREGVTTTYYPNAMMRYTGYYYNDERSGLWQFYDTLGILIQRIDMDQPLNASDSLALKALQAN